MSGYQKLYRKLISDRCFGRVLDYGGGIGDLSLKLAQKGLDVTYAEVEGMNFEFAKWLFAKNKQKIKIINLSQSLELHKKYNVILCIDVIGQVPNPLEVLTNFGSHLDDNGRLIITQLNSPQSKEINPLHLRLNYSADSIFESLNLTRVKNLPKYLTILEKKNNSGK
jgi:2-polyprenyl-3-methyl-5-hydroxy-6-metoxy-1,4-benzoquinol methylase